MISCCRSAHCLSTLLTGRILFVCCIVCRVVDSVKKGGLELEFSKAEYEIKHPDFVERVIRKLTGEEKIGGGFMGQKWDAVKSIGSFIWENKAEPFKFAGKQAWRGTKAVGILAVVAAVVGALVGLFTGKSNNAERESQRDLMRMQTDATRVS